MMSVDQPCDILPVPAAGKEAVEGLRPIKGTVKDVSETGDLIAVQFFLVPDWYLSMERRRGVFMHPETERRTTFFKDHQGTWTEVYSMKQFNITV